MPYSALRDKKNQLIRKARDGSAFLAPYSAVSITTLTTGTATNEVQTVTITGTPTGGSFTLTFSGQTTAAIAWNAAAGAVQTALEALVNIGAGNVAVTGGPGPATPWTVTFVGVLAATDIAQMTATGTLTGGTTPAVAVTTTTPGTGIDLAPLPSGYGDLGWTTTDGVTYGRTTEITEIQSFGALEATRADVTKDVVTMHVVAQETRLNTIGLQTGADPLGIKATAGTGEVSVSKPALPGMRFYRALGLFVDKDDYGREIYMARYMPRARVTAIGEQKYDNGAQGLVTDVTLTGFEDAALGYSHRWIWAGPGWQPLLSAMGIS